MNADLVMENKEESYLPVTWKRAIIVFWALTWRMLLFSFFAAIVIGFIFGVGQVVIATLINGTPSKPSDEVRVYIYFVTQATSLINGIIISVWVTKKILNKRFNTFRIALIPNEVSDKNNYSTGA